VLAEWQKTLFLRGEKELGAKGWLIDVMICIEKLGRKEFSLEEVYGFENALSKKHPDNRHIKPKIRQQLQSLRDKGYLEFIERGHYRLT
jgi:type II restriction enzyme